MSVDGLAAQPEIFSVASLKPHAAWRRAERGVDGRGPKIINLAAMRAVLGPSPRDYILPSLEFLHQFLRLSY
jgi:hypothetical protein